MLENAQLIVVEGPSGVGKTSLARRLASYMNAEVFFEKPENNPWLGLYYEAPRYYGLHAQLHFLFERGQQMRQLKQLLDNEKSTDKVYIADYSSEKNDLFAEVTLDKQCLSLYRQVSVHVAFPHIVPDLIIYLQANVETLLSRIRDRGTKTEWRIEAAYLHKLSEAYNQFFHEYDTAPVLSVNSENLDFVHVERDFELLVARLQSMRSHREFFSCG